jgi:hypothetical protein
MCRNPAGSTGSDGAVGGTLTRTDIFFGLASKIQVESLRTALAAAGNFSG